VLDVETGAPVESAMVQVLEEAEGARAVAAAGTDVGGHFVLQVPGPGTFRLRAIRIGYREVTTPPFDLAPEEVLEVEVLLGSEAIPLAPLVVVSPRPARMDLRLHTRGFYERRREWGREGSGFGHFLDREEVERRNALQVADLLRDFPGVRVESRGGRRPGEITLRAVTSISDFGLRCSPVIFLDGSPVATGAPERPEARNPGVHIDELVSMADVIGVELYPGLSQPARFMRGNCGVIVLWTGGSTGTPEPWSDGSGTFAVEFRLGSGVGDFAPTGADLHWAPGLAGGVRLERRAFSRAFVYFGASQSRFGCTRGACAEVEASFLSKGWELGLRGDLDMMTGRPWLRLGFVRHRLATRWAEEADSGERASSTPGVGLEAEAGLEFPVVHGISLTPGIRYFQWSGSVDRQSLFTDPSTLRQQLRIVVLGVGVRKSF